MPPTVWDEVLGALASTDNEFFIFPKEGRTRVRLIGLGELPNDMFRVVQSTFQGRKRDRWLVMGFTIPESQEEAYRLRCVVFSKTAFRGVVEMAKEGYEFFNMKSAHGISIIRSDAGGRTNYTVMPSPSAVPIPDEIEKSLEDIDIDYFLPKWLELQNQRAQNNQQPNLGQVANLGAAASGPNDW